MNSAVRRAPLVPRVDRAAPLQFLRTAYEADDWIAVFLKHYDTGDAVQRVGPATLFQQPNVQGWLRLMNARHFNVFVSVNAVSSETRVRTRDAVCAIRHVFIEVDHDGRGVLAAINARRDLPPPSYVLHSSPDRVHVLWRATGFTKSAAEQLQKYLARELGADPAATPCSQTTRLPGFLYLKSPVVVTCGTTLISQGPPYVAVTHSRKGEARQRRSRESSFSPGASLLVCRPNFGGVKANRTASTSKAVRSA